MASAAPDDVHGSIVVVIPPHQQSACASKGPCHSAVSSRYHHSAPSLALLDGDASSWLWLCSSAHVDWMSWHKVWEVPSPADAPQALDIACRYHERMEAVYRLHKPKSTVLERCASPLCWLP